MLWRRGARVGAMLLPAAAVAVSLATATTSASSPTTSASSPVAALPAEYNPNLLAVIMFFPFSDQFWVHEICPSTLVPGLAINKIENPECAMQRNTKFPKQVKHLQSFRFQLISFHLGSVSGPGIWIGSPFQFKSFHFQLLLGLGI